MLSYKELTVSAWMTAFNTQHIEGFLTPGNLERFGDAKKQTHLLLWKGQPDQNSNRWKKKKEN